MQFTSKWAAAIHAAASQVLSFGGTLITHEGNFLLSDQHLSLYHVGCSDLEFVKWEDRYKTPAFKFPTDDFSERFLYSVYMEYMEQCRKQLTESAYLQVKEAAEKAAREFSASHADKPQWRIIYDEEDPVDERFHGVISDGRPFHSLFFRAESDVPGELETCHVFNSILMTEDTEECSFPWTDENFGILFDCLNSLSGPEEYSGEGSPIRTLPFKQPSTEEA